MLVLAHAYAPCVCMLYLPTRNVFHAVQFERFGLDEYPVLVLRCPGLGEYYESAGPFIG